MTPLALNGSPLWYAGRAGGTLALILLTATVVLGIASGGRAAPRRIGRFEIGLLHRNLSLLTLAFLALHVATVLLDPFVHLGWAAAVLPFGASYRPLWLGLGTAGFDLLLAVLATSALRLRLGGRRWKAVHRTAYAAWPLALFHAVGTGTDTRLPLQLWLYAGCLAAVVAAVWWRLARAGPGRVTGRLLAALSAGAVPVLLTVFLAGGPLQPGWAHRAAAAAITLGGGR
ncbi:MULTISPECIES: ferric reductase-like transmembrane domain-containing protein [unclassified Streptomyces]|uniref:ferric reductase-like transmembrane domain-containing protein n=1 Tax=unclassified Streptomyces TaxID=2593676 RepID=UPI001F03711E|nr:MULTISPECIES: ferric reductase-like transmembrane domain-containing protein [unclassified Streptomyces]MCH0562326.1 ferric reductase-like transmembrane domain-containing protein [Streptomyces sp. MUM 2J]MCH0572913.1 ferric reductase-like transmembrane domain-containing protein [Streptomyces sp. MUM 136J]